MLKSLLSMVAATVLLVGTASADTVRIALIDPLTGPMAAAGQSALDHLKFHAEKINANGGINGDKLEIVGLDNKVNPQESLVQLQKAIDDGIRYVTQGNGSSVASALISVFKFWFAPTFLACCMVLGVLAPPPPSTATRPTH